MKASLLLAAFHTFAILPLFAGSTDTLKLLGHAESSHEKEVVLGRLQDIDQAGRNKKFHWLVSRSFAPDEVRANVTLEIANDRVASLGPDRKREKAEELRHAEDRAALYRKGSTSRIRLTVAYDGIANFVARQEWLDGNSVWNYYVKDDVGYRVNDAQKTVEIIASAKNQLRSLTFGLPITWLEQFDNLRFLSAEKKNKETRIFFEDENRAIRLEAVLNEQMQIVSIRVKRANGHLASEMTAKYDPDTAVPSTLAASYYNNDGTLDFRDEWSLEASEDIPNSEIRPEYHRPETYSLSSG